MGDIGCTYFPETCWPILSQILKIETDFFFVLGDLAFFGKEEEIKNTVDFCDQQVKVPIFALCGNHDIEGYSQILGLKNYAVILDNFVILALDNANGTFQGEALSFAKEILGKYTEKRFLIAFHIPPPSALKASAMELGEWKKLMHVTDEHSDRIDCMLTGHLHAFQEYHLDGYRIFITGGGGAPLYDLAEDPLKSHHAIKISCFENGPLNFDVLPVKSGPG
jgi:predicted phosphodiesterase